MIQIGNKKIKGIYIKVGTEVKRLLLQGKTENQIRNFIIYSLKKSLEYQFNESTSSSRSNTFTIDNLISIDEVTVDNGSVTYNIDGNKVTVNVSGSNSRSEYDSTKYSKSASDYKTSNNDSFPSSMGYSSDGYSGTLYKNGGSYVSSGSYKPDEKVNSDWDGAFKGKTYPQYLIDPFHNGKTTDPIYLVKVEPFMRDGEQWYHCWYEGVVTIKGYDTRVWRQDYKGYVYKGGYNYYYKYKINMKYTIKN